MPDSDRRTFLKSVGLAGAVYAPAAAQQPAPAAGAPGAAGALEYPRRFSGRNLHMLAFPLGGIAAGSISLGGRGQLRDWEIFNRPDKGRSPEYAFPAIWVQAGGAPPVARVLEARMLPPYEGATGLGSANAPGLSRLAGAVFTGEFPLAHVAFEDPDLPLAVSLEAFSPFIPLDAEESGLPVAILRYRVKNTGTAAAAVAIGFAIDNPVSASHRDGRRNEFREGAAGLRGLLMSNPQAPQSDPQTGTFALALVNDEPGGKLTHLRGWPQAKWWTSPLLYWDDFSSDGELGPEAAALKPVASLCLKRDIAPGREAAFTFLLAWHFPNRTPQWSGWRAPKGEEQANLGNHYATRFADAWAAAEYAAQHLAALESRTRAFVQAMRESTLPPLVKDAAMSNLSTLVTQTCFRTSDGEFHGFEGANDQRGCCFGNCTHVWNYETATQHLFPTLARSLRRHAFGYSQSEDGAMRHRQLLPDGKERYEYAAADGQMGQVIKAYLDWRLSGDSNLLAATWPHVKRAIEFAWIQGGWDANRDGVMEGVQHNTYDVEFYGPNPQCGIYYLGALRAAEEMARAAGDSDTAANYRGLFERGSRWIDANLFNGEYYVQKVRPIPASEIAKETLGDMGSTPGENPEYQVGDGCLVDQLVGQYLAEVAGLGALVDPKNARKALDSVYRYNYKRSLYKHDCVERVFALNDEAALVICDYGTAKRPKVPFPYFAEVMTGFEYSTAAHMIYAGMVREGIECIGNIRRRYDGERRNPWDEAECGHHYARAMAAWSAVLAVSGFRYDGVERSVTAVPALRAAKFVSFWSSASAWGRFHYAGRFELAVMEGELPVRALTIRGARGAKPSVTSGGKGLEHTLAAQNGRITVHLKDELTLRHGETIQIL